MVSRLSLLFTVACGLALTRAAAQPPSGFRDSKAEIPAVKPVPGPGVVTPEMRGDICMARKMYREAIEAYREGPKDSALLANKIGIGYHQLLDFDAARKQYERAIRLKPDYAEAINNLGTIYYTHKSYRRALNQYRKAIRLSPNAASFYSNLGTAYFARKNYKDAIEAYQHAYDLDPQIFEHRSTTGTTLIERTVEERAKLHFYMAKIYAKAGNTEQALLYIRKALEEGFKDRNKLQEDPEFAKLREMPEFQELMAKQPKVL